MLSVDARRPDLRIGSNERRVKDRRDLGDRDGSRQRLRNVGERRGVREQRPGVVLRVVVFWGELSGNMVLEVHDEYGKSCGRKDNLGEPSKTTHQPRAAPRTFARADQRAVRRKVLCERSRGFNGNDSSTGGVEMKQPQVRQMARDTKASVRAIFKSAIAASVVFRTARVSPLSTCSRPSLDAAARPPHLTRS